MINQNTFERISLPITERAEELILYILRELRDIQVQLIRDPESTINTDARVRALQAQWTAFIDEAQEWADTELATAYLRGIQQANKIPAIATGVFGVGGLLIPNVPSQPISTVAASILRDYPQHHTIYGVFKQQVDNSLQATRLPIIRQHQDRIRDMIIEASDPMYRQGAELTRRELSQRLMRQFSDEGVTGIVYSNGRRVNLDSYSEMVARSQTKNAYNQANINRLQENGIDLVVISVHFPCSDLCEPHQGQVFSISGNSREYPSLQSAIDDGLYHPNCKHSQSGYSEGVTEAPEISLSPAQNREQYEAQMEQRKNERYIKSWKRREVTAITESEMRQASAKVIKWQKEMERHVQGNSFLRMRQDRASIPDGISPRTRYKRAGIEWRIKDR